MTKIYSRIELTAISWVCGQLFSSLFFIDFHRTNFSNSAGPFTSFDPVGFAIFATSPATHLAIVFTQPRCVRFVFGVTAASRNTRFQATC